MNTQQKRKNVRSTYVIFEVKNKLYTIIKKKLTHHATQVVNRYPISDILEHEYTR